MRQNLTPLLPKLAGNSLGRLNWISFAILLPLYWSYRSQPPSPAHPWIFILQYKFIMTLSHYFLPAWEHTQESCKPNPEVLGIQGDSVSVYRRECDKNPRRPRRKLEKWQFHTILVGSASRKGILSRWVQPVASRTHAS